ncbi:MAG TPA: glycosyltransferase [Desulfobacteraceae bacterium]|nr:glycosyltransferase [Desulfobacteraceae bacterium]HPJ68074.1 glycosyltransferase [Desulfobacteraceae bacterium]HPQ28629.1 glycosyltransferase [Desulfobacteraceae bacterium]
MNIPKIIHQTWKEPEAPDHLRVFADSWKLHHPSWEYRLWSDDDNRRFIEASFSWFLPFYDNYSLDIQRADAVRYFILYKYGGIYVDLDVECFRPIESLLEENECVFGLEPPMHCVFHGKDKIISNAFMAVVPGHPFFYEISKELVTYVSKSNVLTDFVLDTTGPFMINRVYNKFKDKDGITLLPSNYLFPLDYREAEEYLNQTKSNVIRDKLKKAYGAHYHLGTWWKGK